jgi:hypothetical protein
MNEDQRLVLLDWARKIHQLEYAHRFESKKWSNVHNGLGIPAFLLASSIALTYKIPKLDSETFSSLPFIFKQEFYIAFCAIVIAILTGLQTFLKPNEKSEIHKSSSNNYEKLRHKLEALIVTTNFVNLESRIDNFKDDWSAIDALNVSNKNFNKGKALAKNKYPDELSFRN